LENQTIKIGSKATLSVLCSSCKKEVPAGEFFSFKNNLKQDVYLCAGCREITAQKYSEEMANPNLIQAALLGGLAAVIAGYSWFWIVQASQWQCGYFSIGVGFLVGYAVHWGSGRKRGPSLQMMSAVLTFITLYVSNYFIVLQSLKNYYATHSSVLFAGGELAYVSPFHPVILRSVFSPIGLVIWGIGIYFAYQIPKHRNI